MAWSDLIMKINELLEGLDLNEAPELFSVKLLPKTRMDKSYCLWSEGLKPNTEYTPKGDRIYPLNTLRITVSFDLGNNNTMYRDEAIAKIEEIISTLIHPDNRSSHTRQMFFIDAITNLYSEEGFWMITDIRFNVEYELFYQPSL